MGQRSIIFNRIRGFCSRREQSAHNSEKFHTFCGSPVCVFCEVYNPDKPDRTVGWKSWAWYDGSTGRSRTALLCRSVQCVQSEFSELPGAPTPPPAELVQVKYRSAPPPTGPAEFQYQRTTRYLSPSSSPSYGAKTKPMTFSNVIIPQSPKKGNQIKSCVDKKEKM